MRLALWVTCVLVLSADSSEQPGSMKKQASLRCGMHSLVYVRTDWVAKHGTHSAFPRQLLFSFKKCREQQVPRWVARGNPAPALRLWLALVSRALPPRHQRSERTLAAVAYSLHALKGPAPHLLYMEDILIKCFLH